MSLPSVTVGQVRAEELVLKKKLWRRCCAVTAWSRLFSCKTYRTQTRAKSIVSLSNVSGEEEDEDDDDDDEGGEVVAAVTVVAERLLLIILVLVEIRPAVAVGVGSVEEEDMCMATAEAAALDGEEEPEDNPPPPPPPPPPKVTKAFSELQESSASENNDRMADVRSGM